MRKVLYCSFSILILITIIIFFEYKTHRVGTQKQFSDKKPNVFVKAVKSTESNHEVLGATTSEEKTYTSPEGKYSLSYPGNWIPDEMQQTAELSGNTPVFTIGPVGEKTFSYPSFIQIAVDDNAKGLTLNDYLTQQFTQSLVFTQVTFANTLAEKTSSIPGPVPTDTYFTQDNTKIYRVKWFHGAEPVITDDEFQKVMSSLAFQK